MEGEVPAPAGNFSRRGAVPIMLSVIGSICSILGLLVTVLLAVLDRKK
jgi:hypothetical protein